MIGPGSRLAHYEIVSAIGKGGMGEVWRARDTKLGREVAIKTLPPEFAEDADRLARFEREAKLLASLNHPNIAAIYGLEEHEGSRFLVLELVEGDTLADQVKRGGMPVAESLKLALQIAEALEAAHEKGVIHRDIKPANIKITPEGRVKVLDFGLAKTEEGLADTVDMSEVETALAATEAGHMLGTPAYMSPEQIRGQNVDQRSDIWAFGCTLFEMLSGRRPFDGETTADLLAKVLERDPDWRALPSGTPAQVRKLLERCLQKDPNLRLNEIGEARPILETASKKHWAPTRRQAIAAAVILALLPGVYWMSHTGAESIQSLAVLPFVNTSGAEESLYLSEGMTESLITDLSRVAELKVLSRNSVSRFADRVTDARVAGQELNVDAVLTGRLLRRAGGVAVSAELIRTSDGSLLWRDQYQQSGDNVLEIQRGIIQKVTRELGVGLSPVDVGRKSTASTASPEAYRLYLQGRYFWNTRTEENLRKSADFFQRSVDLDPTYALAWSGVADAYLMLGAWSVLEPKDVYPRASAAAVRAIELDENLAEPHATLGYLKTLYDWDWSGADREFRRAIQLNPGYATAHHWYAFYLATVGDTRQAIEQIEMARESDPLSPVINAEVPSFYVQARQYETALEETHRVLDLGIPYQAGRKGLARVLALQGRQEEAAQELQDLPQGSGPLGSLAELYALAGDQASAQKELDTLVELASQRYVMPAALAQSYAAVRDKEHALEYFERSVEDHSLVASWLRDPELDWLRPEPRFRALFERMGLNP